MTESTNFCPCCSLYKLKDEHHCDGRLYLAVPFLNFEKFMSNQYRTNPNKRCDVLYHQNHKIVFIELKALNWFLEKKPKPQELKKDIATLRNALKQKFLNSICNWYNYDSESEKHSTLCIVAFSKDVIRLPKLENYNTIWLKNYLQQRFFPFANFLDYNGKKIPILIRQCDKLEQFFA